MPACGASVGVQGPVPPWVGAASSVPPSLRAISPALHPEPLFTDIWPEKISTQYLFYGFWSASFVSMVVCWRCGAAKVTFISGEFL